MKASFFSFLPAFERPRYSNVRKWAEYRQKNTCISVISVIYSPCTKAGEWTEQARSYFCKRRNGRKAKEKRMKKITELVRELALPAVEEAGCTLWDVEYVREAGQWYLRLYIDKTGGVNILDCEAISRKVSDLLDEADPIESSYIFEVASAGAERPLKRESDFAQFMGSPIVLKTYQPHDGCKEFSGDLTGYDAGAVEMRVGEATLRFEKNEIALVRLRCDI